MPRRVYKPRKGFRRPLKKGYNIRRRLNVNRRRLFKRRRFQKIHRAIGGFPNAKTVALRYSDTVYLNPSSTGLAVNVFRINNIYDPDYTGTGHQPMFADNYEALYQKYRVNSCTVTWIALQNHIVNTTTTTQSAGDTIGTEFYLSANQRSPRLFILKDDQVNDLPSNLDTLIEEGNRNLVWRFCPQNTSSSMQKLSMIAYPSQLYKCPRNDSGLQSSTGAGPAKECYFICGVAGFPGGFDADNMAYQVILTYNVTYFDLKKNQTQN